VVTSLLLNYVASSVGNSVSFNILHAVYISSIQLWYPWYFSIIEEITGENFCEDSGNSHQDTNSGRQTPS